MFNNIVGQGSVKEILKVHVNSFRNGGVIPSLYFVAPKGCGKTMLAKEFSKELKQHSLGKRWLEINCGVINRNNFIDLWNDEINLSNVSVLFDECHGLIPAVEMLLLSLLNPNRNNRNSIDVEHPSGRVQLEANFRDQTFMFATTEPNKVFHALADRLERIDFEEYKHNEMKQIILDYLEYDVPDRVLDMVISRVEFSPRHVIRMANRINGFLLSEGKRFLTEDTWKRICQVMKIYPMGISSAQVRVLKELKEGPKSLQGLMSTLGLSRAVVQHDTEPPLLKRKLMYIDGKRMLSKKGEILLTQIEKEFTV